MANTFAPNGFQQYQGNGVTPSYEQAQAAVISTNTNPIYQFDPVTYACGTTGLSTGYITQGYGPVTLTVAATAITTSAAGVLTVTFTAPVATSGNLPTSPGTWAPPVGSTLVITGATGTAINLNGAFTITSSTTTTAIVANSGATISGTSTASGTVSVIVPIVGVFTGCKYLSVANKYPAFRPYWPGSDANGDVTAYLTSDPLAQFSVMTGNSNTTATAVGFSNIGQNISFSSSQSGVTTTNGNTSTGLSTMFADQFSLIANSAVGPAGNAYLPFRIVGLQNYVPGAVSPLATINGNDNTTAYNRVIVALNNAMSRGFVGI